MLIVCMDLVASDLEMFMSQQCRIFWESNDGFCLYQDSFQNILHLNAFAFVILMVCTLICDKYWVARVTVQTYFIEYQVTSSKLTIDWFTWKRLYATLALCYEHLCGLLIDSTNWHWMDSMARFSICPLCDKKLLLATSVAQLRIRKITNQYIAITHPIPISWLCILQIPPFSIIISENSYQLILR